MNNTLLISISSRDRQYNSIDNSKFSVPLRLGFGDFRGYTISLDSIQFMNSNPSVTGYNNKIYFQENGGAILTATIPTGNYNSTTYAATVATQMTAVGTLVYTATLSTLTDKMAITVTPPDVFNFVAGDYQAYETMGLDIFALPTPSASAIALTGIVDLSGSKFVDVCLNLPVNVVSSNDLPVFARVPVEAPYGHMVHYESATQDEHFIQQPALDRMDVRLYDDRGFPYVLATNSFVSMTFKLNVIS